MFVSVFIVVVLDILVLVLVVVNLLQSLLLVLLLLSLFPTTSKMMKAVIKMICMLAWNKPQVSWAASGLAPDLG